jgi:general secretion pathway protein D
MKICAPFFLLLLLPSRPLAAQDPVQQPTPGGVLVDFQDTELRLVISALAEAAGLNVIYGELPSRRITLQMRRPVPPEQVAALLRSVAQSNGLRVIDEDGLLRLEPTEPVGARAAAQDTAEGQPELRLFVHRLRHARAARLAATLQAIFGGGGVPGFEAAQTRRPLSEMLREQHVPPARLEPEAPAPPPVVVPPGLPAQLHGEIQIVPDEATNSLLVRARPDDWEVLRQTIAAMDLRPLQVLIEVVIAEVRRTRDLTVGVSGTISGKGGSAELEGATGGDFTLKVARTGEIDINVTLSAMAANGEVRILSRPVLLAQNNQEARILIGAERPFVQVYRALPTDAAVRDQVVQYRDVGTSLSIVPTINEEGYVNLQVAQEVSTATSETQFGAPVISTREASTHLFIRDGHTAVLGGLIDRQDSRSRSGVPLLKDIPLVGMLFGTTQRNFSQSELFLFITPHVITSDDDTARLRGDLQRGTELLRDTTVADPLVPRP